MLSATLSLLMVLQAPGQEPGNFGECSVGPEGKAARVALEQARWDDAARGLAQAYAPVLGFAPGERYFPTIPFFTAFDGVDNTGNGAIDFRDPGEISLLHQPEKLPSWTRLSDIYQQRDMDLNGDHGRRDFGLDRVVVLYRICTLEPQENRNIVTFLKSDEQAWDRHFKDDTPLTSIFGGEPRFHVIQYFLYYVADVGLQGHPQDIELVSVFIPTDPARRSKFRIVVGSGHLPRTPNNVLVLSSWHLGFSTIAKAFQRDTTPSPHPDNIHVLVELGGHSSSPDLPPYGEYTAGVDVNWNVYDVWGTRDIQAVAGIGYMGSYRPSMTFTRDFNAVTVFPPHYQEREMRAEQVNTKQGPPPAPPGASQSEGKDPHQYRLLPVRLLLGLDQALADPEVPSDEVAAWIDAIQTELRRQRGTSNPVWNGELFSKLRPASVQDTAIAHLRYWRAEMIVDDTLQQRQAHNYLRPGMAPVIEPLWIGARTRVAGSRHRIWDHESYKGDPTKVFKANLFRPTAGTLGGVPGMIRRLSIGYRGITTEANEVYLGFVIPAFRSRGFPVRMPGFMEAQVGMYWGRGGQSFSLGLLHENHRNSRISWYAAGSWVPRRASATRIAGAGEFGLSGGLSLLPYLSDSPFLNAVRIRSGVRFDPFQGKDVLGRVRWELTLAIRQ